MSVLRGVYVSKLRVRERGMKKERERMSEFYNSLAEKMQSGSCVVMTVLEGESAGRKLLVTEPVEQYEGHAVFCERAGSLPRLVICGGGHVSIPMIRMGKMLGFQVTVLEDRPKFADNARVAGADVVICDSFEYGLERISGGDDTYFIIVTRGHRYDEVCLGAIVEKPNAYIGMMGSRRRVAIVKEELFEQGHEREKLDEVYTPIGLKIGAETPEEIAVSVMAEIIQVKHEKAEGCEYSKELLEALCDEDGKKQKKVLATIISRKGSAPRGVETKMLILEDGTLIDTIGGGCAESDVITKALLMMREEKVRFQICMVDMTREAAEEEGMVCGGRIEVMLERV